jgi:NDP-sugar pyrophosphorylase family protein
MRTIAVLAGGLGTRVADLTGGQVPKALLPVAGKPFLHHKLVELRRLGADHVVLLLGHQAEAIVDFVGNGRRWGVPIDVIEDGPVLLGTGGALKQAAHLLPEHFWVTYGDTLLDVDLDAAERRARAAGWDAVLTVLHNRDRWQRSNVRVDRDLIVSYEKAPPRGTHEYIDYGYLFLPRSAVVESVGDVFDLGSVVQNLIASRTLGAFEAAVPFHTIGTPDELHETDSWLREVNAGRARTYC